MEERRSAFIRGGDFSAVLFFRGEVSFYTFVFFFIFSDLKSYGEGCLWSP
jgi:hypothetical protein